MVQEIKVLFVLKINLNIHEYANEQMYPIHMSQNVEKWQVRAIMRVLQSSTL